MEEKNPIVFISYSHDSKEHQDKVLKLSNKLRSEGIDCILDQYEESPPEGWPKWMDRGIRQADFVLLICTEVFYNRVIGEDPQGKGVNWESRIIYQYLYNLAGNNRKFIPILFENGKTEFIPEPIQGATFYKTDTEDGYEKLYWRLRGVKTIEKPTLGKLRSLPERERKTLFLSGLINQEDWDNASWKNGAAYLWTENSLYPPVLVLLFETMEKGQTLFQGLIDKIGKQDKSDRLRISIVEGQVPKQDDGYFIVIGENIDATEKIIKDIEDSKNIEYVVINQRIHRVFCEGESPNLKKFKEEFDKFKCYYLAPGVQLTKEDSSKSVEVNYDYTIMKKRIEFRQYNDISKQNDPDSILKSENVLNHKF